MKNILTGNRKPALIIVLMVLILGTAWIVFSPSLKSDFIYTWDDNINVTSNQHIRDWSWSGINQLFNPGTRIDEPRLTLLTYAWEYQEHSLNPAPYHMHNLLLHLCNLILLFFFVRKILKKDFLALVAVFIFAVHPLHVEPVAWITGRKDLLFSFFYLCSLISYLHYLERPKRRAWFVLALSFAFLGLLAKIQAMSLVLAWFALDVYYQRKISVASLYEKFMLLVVMLYNYFTLIQIIVLFIVYVILLVWERIELKNLKSSTALRFHVMLKPWVPWLMIFAIGLLSVIVLVGVNMGKGVYIDKQVLFLSSFEFLAIISLCIIHFYKTKRILIGLDLSGKKIRRAGVTILLLAVFVMAGFSLPKLYYWTGDFHLNFSVTDRLFMACYSLMYYVLHFFVPLSNSPIQPYPSDIGTLPWIYYLSAGGVLLLIALFIFLLRKTNGSSKRSVIFGIIFFLINIVMVLHLVSIEGRVIVADRYAYLAIAGLLIALLGWLDPFLEKSHHKANGIFIAAVIIIGVTFSMGSFLRTAIWKNGVSLFSLVIKHYPEYHLAYSNRGTLYLNAQQNRAAIADFDRAILLDGTEEITYYNRALAWYNLGQADSAYKDCSCTIQCNPLFYDAFYLRAFIKNQQGNFPGALADYNATIRLKPDHKMAWYNRGNTRKNLYDYMGAISDYDNCLSLDPQFDLAYSGKGVALFFLGDYLSSVRCFDEAIKRKPREGNYFFNRGLSKLKLNLTEEACRDFNTSWGLGYSASKELIKVHCQ